MWSLGQFRIATSLIQGTGMDLPGRGWVGGGENGKMVIRDWAVVRLAGRVGWGVWLMHLSLARKRGPETREAEGRRLVMEDLHSNVGSIL